MNEKLVLLAVTGTNGKCPAPATYAPCRCDPAATASFPEDFTLFCPTLQGIKTHLIIVIYLYYLLELRDDIYIPVTDDRIDEIFTAFLDDYENIGKNFVGFDFALNLITRVPPLLPRFTRLFYGWFCYNYIRVVPSGSFNFISHPEKSVTGFSVRHNGVTTIEQDAFQGIKNVLTNGEIQFH